VINRDAKLERLDDVERTRPGHADLAGSIKHLGGVRAVLERASARETAARVAAGALARQLLAVFGIEVAGWVRELGGVVLGGPENGLEGRSAADLRAIRDSSAIYSLFPARDPDVTSFIDRVGKEGDTLGGIVEVQITGLPIGLGTHAQWDRKLDGRLAQAVMAVQAIKGVEIGMGFETARRRGSEVHDAIAYAADERDSPSLGFTRPTNNAGGLEAGMTNGQPLVVKAAMKPISTLRKPLGSVNLRTKEAEEAAYERSDVCAVSACSVIIENVVAFEVAAALVDKFGGDSIEEMQARWRLYHDLARQK
jgi:chorismate synthase